MRLARLTPKIREAIEESMANLPERVRWEVEKFAHGVIVGQAPDLEKHTSLLYRAFAPLRKALGGTVTMYRGQPVEPPKLNRKWLSWTTDPHMAALFTGDRSDQIIEAKVKASDVVAGILSPHNPDYIEFLVKNRPEYQTRSQMQVPIYYGFYMPSVPWGTPMPDNYDDLSDREKSEWEYPDWQKWLRDNTKAVERVGGEVLHSNAPDYGDDKPPFLGVLMPADKELPPSLAALSDADYGHPMPKYLGRVASLDPARVQGISEYFAEREFSSRTDAARALHRMLVNNWPPMPEEEATATVAEFPFYRDGRDWKIGVPIVEEPKRFSWSDVTIKRNNLQVLETAGYVNLFDGPRLGSVKLVPLKDLQLTERGKDRQFIERQAQRLLDGDKEDFLAIVHHEGAIIDGHHRWWIAKELGMDKVPAQEVTYRNLVARVAERYLVATSILQQIEDILQQNEDLPEEITNDDFDEIADLLEPVAKELARGDFSLVLDAGDKVVKVMTDRREAKVLEKVGKTQLPTLPRVYEVKHSRYFNLSYALIKNYEDLPSRWKSALRRYIQFESPEHPDDIREIAATYGVGEEEARHFFEALEWLDDHGVKLSDWKEANVMWDTDHKAPVLVDLGEQ